MNERSGTVYSGCSTEVTSYTGRRSEATPGDVTLLSTTKFPRARSTADGSTTVNSSASDHRLMPPIFHPDPARTREGAGNGSTASVGGLIGMTGTVNDSGSWMKIYINQSIYQA